MNDHLAGKNAAIAETEAISLARGTLKPEMKISNETTVRVEFDNGRYIVMFGDTPPVGSFGADFIIKITINATTGEVEHSESGT